MTNMGELMEKIFIVGIVASGKTTLAKSLSAKLCIPWYELDYIVHYKTETERYKRTPKEQLEVIEEIDKNSGWIFEGTDRESYRVLFDMADRVIFLDPPLWRRKIRIFLRSIKQQFGIEKCEYKSDITMLKNMYKWTAEFEENRQKFDTFLEKYNDKLIRLSDNKDLDFITSKILGEK